MSRKQRSRDQIISAAIVEFERHGVEAVSMNALAEAAGLTRATVYNLFDSKQDIAAAIVQQKVAEWSVLFAPRIAANEHGLTLLKQALFKNAEICMEYPHIALNVMTKPQKTMLPDVDKGKSFRLLIQDIIELCQQQGQLRADQKSTYLLFLILGIYTQMMIFAITSGNSIGEAEIAQLLQILCEGIGNEVVQ